MNEHFPTIMRGAEPFFLPRGPLGCLIIHGFTATPQEVHWFGEKLAQAGISVLAPRLAGHGTRLPDLARTRWTDWLASAEDGYRILKAHCEHIVLAGLSLGGVLALILAGSHTPLGVLVMSTPHSILLDPTGRRLWPFLPLLARVKPYRPKGPPDWRDPQAGLQRVHYQAYPFRSFIELEHAMRAMRQVLPKLTLPVRFIHSREDDFAPPEHMRRNFELCGSAVKDQVWVENSNHIITADAARERVLQAAREFIEGLAPGAHRE